MALLAEVMVVSGVALDLVGAGVLAHSANAESIVELREEIGEEGSAVGEPDALSTHATLLAEKRIGFLSLTVGLLLYLGGLVLKSSESTAVMAGVALAVVVGGVLTSVLYVRISRRRVLARVRHAEAKGDPDELPEQ